MKILEPKGSEDDGGGGEGMWYRGNGQSPPV